MLVPEAGLAVVVLTNSRGGHALCGAIVDWALREVLRLPEPVPLPAGAVPGVEGDYEAGAWRQRITRVGGRLFQQMVLPDGSSDEVRAAFEQPPAELLPVGVDQLARPERPWEPVGDVGRAADGSVAWLRYGLRLMPRI